MAGTPRKTATKTAARERARAAAAAALEKENRLLDAAENFFLATASTDRKKEQLQAKIDKLTAELAELDSPSPEAGQHVQAMKDEGISNKDVAARLELTSAEVNSYLRTIKDDKSTSSRSDDQNAPTDLEEGSLVATESQQ
ncbi:hypothetical protein [Kocuria massiliensis]|uniref:hypothetical protein n=1 Tax=Kocuria massiliensis TaxID=1926282 RepID=UPI0022B99F8E|nr:hypothetical protein [Kocuria massiliensis]